MDDLFIDMGITVILRIVKDPKKVAKFKAALRKVRDALQRLPLDV